MCISTYVLRTVYFFFLIGFRSTNMFFVGGSDACMNLRAFRDAAGRSCETLESLYLDGNGTECSTNYVDFNSGRSQYAACCYCGNQSGFNPDVDRINWIQEATPSNETCFDYHRWKTVDEITCDNYDEHFCNWSGYLKDLLSGSNASESCCICGGGYRGDLIGRIFRVGYPANGTADSVHLMYKQENGFVRGSMPHFLGEVMQTKGAGSYPVTIFTESARSKHASTYSQCVEDLSLGNVDICMGPFWATYSRGNKANRTHAFAHDDLYIVSYVESVDFSEALLSVFRPFGVYCWIAILAMLFIMGISLNIVGRLQARVKKKACRNVFSYSLHVIYVSLRSFIIGDAVETSDEPSLSEKCIAIGFAVSSLLIITAYTATAAAYLVLDDSQVEYSTLGDVLADKSAKVCVFSASKEDIEIAYPELRFQLKAIDMFTYEILDEVIDRNGECSLAILPLADYEVAILQNEERKDVYCKRTTVIRDGSFHVELDLVFFFSPYLGKYGDELFSLVNSFIDSGDFQINFFDAYYYTSKKYNFRPPESDTKLRRLNDVGKSYNVGYGTIDLSFCSSAKNGNDGNTSLDIFELSFPFLFSLSCCFIGICMFYIAKYKKFRRATKAKEITKDSNVHKVSAGVDAEEFLLRESAKHLSTSSIVFELKRNDDILKQDLDSAIDMLPNRDEVEKLFISSKLSPSASEFQEIYNTMKLSDLFHVLEEAGIFHHQDRARQLKFIFDSDENPKKKILNMIFANNRAKDLAIMRSKKYGRKDIYQNNKSDAEEVFQDIVKFGNSHNF